MVGFAEKFSPYFIHKTKDRESEQQAGYGLPLRDRHWNSLWAMSSLKRQAESKSTHSQSHKTDYVGTHKRQVASFPRLMVDALYQPTLRISFAESILHVLLVPPIVRSLFFWQQYAGFPQGIISPCS